MLEDPNIAEKLEQAGLRGPRPITIFYFFRFLLPFVGALGAFIYIFLINDHGLQPTMKYGSIVFGAAIGFYAYAYALYVGFFTLPMVAVGLIVGLVAKYLFRAVST